MREGAQMIPSCAVRTFGIIITQWLAALSIWRVPNAHAVEIDQPPAAEIIGRSEAGYNAKCVTFSADGEAVFFANQETRIGPGDFTRKEVLREFAIGAGKNRIVAEPSQLDVTIVRDFGEQKIWVLSTQGIGTGLGWKYLVKRS